MAETEKHIPAPIAEAARKKVAEIAKPGAPINTLLQLIILVYGAVAVWGLAHHQGDLRDCVIVIFGVCIYQLRRRLGL